MYQSVIKVKALWASFVLSSEKSVSDIPSSSVGISGVGISSNNSSTSPYAFSTSSNSASDIVPCE
jgi:hypothetical protein